MPQGTAINLGWGQSGNTLKISLLTLPSLTKGLKVEALLTVMSSAMVYGYVFLNS